jgi:hypothetical protein
MGKILSRRVDEVQINLDPSRYEECKVYYLRAVEGD